MKKVFMILEGLSVLSMLFLSGCASNPSSAVLTGNCTVKETESDNVYYYVPVEEENEGSREIENPEYGIIFYLGTIISPEYYRNLATILASEGYVVCMPKNLFAYVMYDKSKAATEEILETYPDTQFFLAGHSQGGGAATKMTNENRGKYLGTMLLSPLSYSKDSFADSDIPALFFQAENDCCLSDSQKAESKTTLPENAQIVFLEGCNHMGYSSMTIFSDADILNLKIMDGECTVGVEKQQQLVADYMLEFMNRVK